MQASQRLFGASVHFLRHAQPLNRAQWRNLERQCHRQLSSRAVTRHLRSSRRHASTSTEAAKTAATATAKATVESAKSTASNAAKTTADAAKTTAKATASGGSRITAYLYGSGLVLLLSFGYLYITDTRATVHQYVVVPLLRFIHHDPEEAHHTGIRYIKGLYDFNLHPRERGNLDQKLGDLKVEVFGHILDNPIGTSAGIDKDAEIPSALMALGPAIVEVGGATPLPQEGNPKPRVFRIPSQNALINRYGLNSKGAEHVAMQLRERVRSFAYAHGLGLGPESERIILDSEADVPPGSLVPGKLLAVQIAKNKTTPDHDIAAVASDYVYCVDHLAKYADILVVNVSSPNTPGLRDLQATGPLTAILSAVVEAAKSVDRKTKPAVMVKVSPDEDSDAQIEGICSAVWSSGVDGVIVGNTTKKRPDPVPKGYIMPASETKILSEIGGYSGPQMFERTLNLVARYRNKLDMGPQEEAPAPKKESQQGSSSKQISVDDAASSAGSVRDRPAGAEGEAMSPRDAAEGTLKKIITQDGTEPSCSPSPSKTEDVTKPSSSDLPAKVIFATGGISNGEQCLQILNAGASVCQVYTAMMYGGVGTVTRMKSEMREAIKKQNSK